jgi:hypothetical protein
MRLRRGVPDLVELRMVPGQIRPRAFVVRAFLGLVVVLAAVGEEGVADHMLA